MSDEPDPRQDGPDEPAPPRRRSARRTVLLVVAGLVVVLVLATAWLVVRVYQAGRALNAAQDDLQTISQQARDGDLSALETTLPPARDDLRRARQAVDDPVWRAALVVPWLGRQLGAVRTVTVALDDAAQAVGPLVDAADDLTGAKGSGIDLSPLVAAAPEIRASAAKVAADAPAVAAVDASALTPRLAGPVRSVQDEYSGVGSAAGAIAHVAAVLPAMLGAEGPRTYLLTSLNSAELRAQGGIAGAFAVLRVDGTSVTLVEQRSTASFQALDRPVLPLTSDEQKVFGDRLGEYVQDALTTPDFPRAAQLLAARWDRDTGEHVDGVVATDVVAVSDVLRATGPVTTSSGATLDADGLVQALLQQAYLRLDRNQADTFFAQVAATVFQAVAGGRADARTLVRELADAAGQGRVRLWSAHGDEQAQLLATTVGGGFLTGPYAADAGVFLDDGTGGKLDYYLTTTVTVDSPQCTAAQPTATVHVELRYDPPSGVAHLPWWVVGVGTSGLPAGDLATNVSVYAPVGASLGALGYGEGEYVSGQTGTLDGRAVQTVTARLAPGQSASYSVPVPLHDGSLTVWSTPTLTSDGSRTVVCGQG